MGMNYKDAVRLTGVTTDRVYRQAKGIPAKAKLSGNKNRERVRPLGVTYDTSKRSSVHYFHSEDIFPETENLRARADTLECLLKLRGEVREIHNVITDIHGEMEGRHVRASSYFTVDYSWGRCFFVPPLKKIDNARYDTEPILALLVYDPYRVDETRPDVSRSLLDIFSLDVSDSKAKPEAAPTDTEFYAVMQVPENVREGLYRRFKDFKSSVTILLITYRDLQGSEINKNTLPIQATIGGGLRDEISTTSD